MISVTLGTPISEVAVTNVSPQGLWLLIQGEKMFLPFEHFPWFKNAPIGKLFQVELQSPNHLYWPELDVDLAVDSIRHPEQYPLVSRCLG